jgi:hypothetical protein
VAFVDLFLAIFKKNKKIKKIKRNLGRKKYSRVVAPNHFFFGCLYFIYFCLLNVDMEASFLGLKLYESLY